MSTSFARYHLACVLFVWPFLSPWDALSDERGGDVVATIHVGSDAVAIGPDLFGIFFGDINYAADGGSSAGFISQGVIRMSGRCSLFGALVSFCVSSLLGSMSWAAPPAGILTGGADPTIVAAQNAAGQTVYYVVSTGRGINISSSTNLREWQHIGKVFSENVPTWAKQEVPRSNGIWAPDLSYHDGLYYLYYSVSSFGSQRSVIGLAVNKTMDPDSPDYRWEDRGKVLESWPGRVDYNAIDPALFVDASGQWHLFFGSFWSGIKVVSVDPATGKPADGAAIRPVASRPQHPTHAIEAPFVIRHGDYYYLFVSWDRCCDGADSDYKVAVGRSPNASGPYVDAAGRSLLEGGGTVVLEGNDRWRGPGHNSVLTTAAGQWMVHHTYDVQNLRAQRVLQIRPITWSDEGWPEVGAPLNTTP